MSEFIPPKGHSPFISKVDAKRMVNKLRMKYQAELTEMTAKMASEKAIHGFVTLETEAENERLIARIKAEDKTR